MPTQVLEIEDAVAIDAGMDHTCVLHADGGVSCWGWNRDGQVGRGVGGHGHPDKTEWDAFAPVRVEGITRATAISAVGTNTCARTDDGLVHCWGFASFGAIGDGGQSSGTRPSAVRELPYADEMHAGGCARGGESVWCWGHASGDGTDAIRSLPVRVTGAEPSMQLERDGFTCSLMVGGHVRCWGFSLREDPLQLSPIDIPGLADIERIRVGGAACACDAANEAMCWGGNFYGNLGDGSRHDRREPVRMPHWDGARDVELGSAHSCGIRADGTLACTGYNAAGQLGDGSTTDHYTPRCVAAFGS